MKQKFPAKEPATQVVNDIITRPGYAFRQRSTSRFLIFDPILGGSARRLGHSRPLAVSTGRKNTYASFAIAYRSGATDPGNKARAMPATTR